MCPLLRNEVEKSLPSMETVLADRDAWIGDGDGHGTHRGRAEGTESRQAKADAGRDADCRRIDPGEGVANGMGGIGGRLPRAMNQLAEPGQALVGAGMLPLFLDLETGDD